MSQKKNHIHGIGLYFSSISDYGSNISKLKVFFISSFFATLENGSSWPPQRFLNAFISCIFGVSDAQPNSSQSDKDLTYKLM